MNTQHFKLVSVILYSVNVDPIGLLGTCSVLRAFKSVYSSDDVKKSAFSLGDADMLTGDTCQTCVASVRYNRGH